MNCIVVVAVHMAAVAAERRVDYPIVANFFQRIREWVLLVLS
jgi:hypothetical protein